MRERERAHITFAFSRPGDQDDKGVMAHALALSRPGGQDNKGVMAHGGRTRSPHIALVPHTASSWESGLHKPP